MRIHFYVEEYTEELYNFLNKYDKNIYDISCIGSSRVEDMERYILDIKNVDFDIGRNTYKQYIRIIKLLKINDDIAYYVLLNFSKFIKQNLIKTYSSKTYFTDLL